MKGMNGILREEIHQILFVFILYIPFIRVKFMSLLDFGEFVRSMPLMVVVSLNFHLRL